LSSVFAWNNRYFISVLFQFYFMLCEPLNKETLVFNDPEKPIVIIACWRSSNKDCYVIVRALQLTVADGQWSTMCTSHSHNAAKRAMTFIGMSVRPRHHCRPTICVGRYSYVMTFATTSTCTTTSTNFRRVAYNLHFFIAVL